MCWDALFHAPQWCLRVVIPIGGVSLAGWPSMGPINPVVHANGVLVYHAVEMYRAEAMERMTHRGAIKHSCSKVHIFRKNINPQMNLIIDY